MRVITKATLQDFWTEHQDAKAGLEGWCDLVKHAEWSQPIEVRQTVASADTIGDFVVFNICKNAYRLVVRADYRHGNLFVWGVYTHAAYDRIDLRAIDLAIRQGTYKR